MTLRVHSIVASGMLFLGLAVAGGCGRQSPVSPTTASTPSAATGIQASHLNGLATMRPDGGSVVTVSLTGNFVIANSSGDSLSGTYTGTAASSPVTTERALLTLNITQGTGVYAGATGSADAVGSGAFSGEGPYTLDARGDAVLAGGKHAQITLSLSGTSVASCTAASEFIITQTGAGTMGRAGRVTATFRHQVTGGAGCVH